MLQKPIAIDLEVRNFGELQIPGEQFAEDVIRLTLSLPKVANFNFPLQPHHSHSMKNG